MANDRLLLFDSEELQIIEKDWFTPNTYSNNFKPFPEMAGVYLIVGITFDPYNREIIYVGSTSNLSSRCSKHEVKRSSRQYYDHTAIYFKEFDSTELAYEYEKSLIKIVQPKINVQWR